MEPSQQAKRKKTLYSTIAIMVGMFGLAYGSVPLYDMFCRMTGFGGTTQVSAKPTAAPLSRTMIIRFNADVSSDIPWLFKPQQNTMKVRVGEEKLAFFEAKNESNQPITGTATFNVTPLKAGSYFDKIECFCFSKQTIKPGQVVRFPVSFFIDPSIMNDPNMDDIETITLSYTFFRVKGS